MPPSGKDLLKYMTERAVRYIELPKVERKQYKTMKKEAWQYRWFGMMPVSLRIWKERWFKKRRNETLRPKD